MRSVVSYLGDARLVFLGPGKLVLLEKRHYEHAHKRRAHLL